MTWNFDWALGTAQATLAHGTYRIMRESPGRWTATFVRADTQPYRRTARPLKQPVELFSSLASAMSACQRHADRFISDSSSRLADITLPP